MEESLLWLSSITEIWRKQYSLNPLKRLSQHWQNCYLGKPISSVITLVQRCAYQLLVLQKDIDDHLEVLHRAALDAKVKLYRTRFVQAMQPWVQYISICFNGFLDQEHKISANTAYCFAFQGYYLLTGVAQRVKLECIVHCSTNFLFFFFLRKLGTESVSLTSESQAVHYEKCLQSMYWHLTSQFHQVLTLYTGKVNYMVL